MYQTHFLWKCVYIMCAIIEMDHDDKPNFTGKWRTGRKPVYSDCPVSLIPEFILCISGVFQIVAQFIVDIYQLIYQTCLYILNIY